MGPLDAVLDGARLGRVFVERQMGSTAMVVVHVCPERPLKVLLVEQGGVIQQLATDCSDHALDVRILPGGTRGRNHLGDAHSFGPARGRPCCRSRRDLG